MASTSYAEDQFLLRVPPELAEKLNAALKDGGPNLDIDLDWKGASSFIRAFQSRGNDATGSMTPPLPCKTQTIEKGPSGWGRRPSSADYRTCRL